MYLYYTFSILVVYTEIQLWQKEMKVALLDAAMYKKEIPRYFWSDIHDTNTIAETFQ